MKNFEENSIGDAWLELVRCVETEGVQLADEGKEVTDIRVTFKNSEFQDEILKKFADIEMIDIMKNVFFDDKPNKIGHSYKNLTHGPYDRNDLSDIVELLKEKENCKRATLTLCGLGNGKIPCINVVNFLIRDGYLNVYYFSRGQDVYKKFYADAICIAEMQSIVSNEIKIKKGTITGYIASIHTYYEDAKKIKELISYKGLS